MSDLIDRQAAIDALRKKQDNGKGDISRFYNTIIQHDIEAIMALPSSLSTNLAEVGTDSISRQQVIDALRNYLVGKNVPCDGTLTCRLIENEVINKLPSAQPEIVRCKDCKYNATSKKCLNPNSFFLVPADDDFCSYAERREDE